MCRMIFCGLKEEMKKKKLNVNLEIIKIIENFLKIIEIDIEGSY